MGLTVKKKPAIMGLNSAALEKAQSAASFAIASLVAERIKWNVRNGVLHLKPKKRANNDPRPLIDTETYINELTPVRVGAKGAAIRGDVVLMKRLEYGTRTMPARPHIRPTLRMLRKEIGNVIADNIVGSLLGKRPQTRKKK